MSRTLKTIICTISIFLILTILLGLCFEVFGTDKLKPSNWFNKTEDSQDSEEKQGDSTSMFVSEIENSVFLTLSMGENSSESSNAKYVQGSIDLVATVTPNDCFNKACIFEFAWQDSESAWAVGKNVEDYLTVTNVNDYSINVKSEEAFGEPVVVTVTSVDNLNATASCTLQYLKRIMNVNLNLSGDAVSGESLKKISFGEDITVSYEVVYGVGTIQGEFVKQALKTTLMDGLFNSCSNAVTVSNVNKNKVSTMLINLPPYIESTTVQVGNCDIFITAMGNPGNSKNQWESAFYDYVNSHGNGPLATVSFEYSYTFNTVDGVKTITTGSASEGISFNLESLVKHAESVSLDNSNLVF